MSSNSTRDFLYEGCGYGRIEEILDGDNKPERIREILGGTIFGTFQGRGKWGHGIYIPVIWPSEGRIKDQFSFKRPYGSFDTIPADIIAKREWCIVSQAALVAGTIPQKKAKQAIKDLLGQLQEDYFPDAETFSGKGTGIDEKIRTSDVEIYIHGTPGATRGRMLIASFNFPSEDVTEINALQSRYKEHMNHRRTRS